MRPVPFLPSGRPVLIALVFVALRADPGWADEQESLTTVIIGTQEDDEENLAWAGDERARLTSGATNGEESLEALGGLRLLRSGGPLAPVRAEHRGMAGPRLMVDVDGLSLAGPGAGEFDLGLLPFLALHAGEVGAGKSSMGQLSLETLDSSWPRATGRITVGSASTLLAGGAVASDLGPGQVLAAVDVGRSEGNFEFAPATAQGEVRKRRLRQGNDQARASALLKAQTMIAGVELQALALGGAREGGIPGFSSSPTDGLRQRKAMGAFRLRARWAWQLGSARVQTAAAVSARAEHRSTRTGGRTPPAPRPWSSVASVAQAAEASAKLEARPLGLVAFGRARVLGASVVDRAFHRRGLAADLGWTWRPVKLLPRAFRAGPWLASAADWVRLRGSVGGQALSDVGPLERGAVSIELGPAWANLGAGVRRATRAPTLAELFAPRGLIIGNPSLRPERSTDAEIWIRSRLAEPSRCRGADLPAGSTRPSCSSTKMRSRSNLSTAEPSGALDSRAAVIGDPIQHLA